VVVLVGEAGVKIYVVILEPSSYYDGDTTDVRGVYSSLELAKASVFDGEWDADGTYCEHRGAVAQVYLAEEGREEKQYVIYEFELNAKAEKPS
jgi:hypothetical protein